ncbi:MAG TPA: hypothetical protein V6C97_03550 [Oculatellaceae cyanobacterium]
MITCELGVQVHGSCYGVAANSADVQEWKCDPCMLSFQDVVRYCLAAITSAPALSLPLCVYVCASFILRCFISFLQLPVYVRLSVCLSVCLFPSFLSSFACGSHLCVCVCACECARVCVCVCVHSMCVSRVPFQYLFIRCCCCCCLFVRFLDTPLVCLWCM